MPCDRLGGDHLECNALVGIASANSAVSIAGNFNRFIFRQIVGLEFSGVFGRAVVVKFQVLPVAVAIRGNQPKSKHTSSDLKGGDKPLLESASLPIVPDSWDRASRD